MSLFNIKEKLRKKHQMSADRGFLSRIRIHVSISLIGYQIMTIPCSIFLGNIPSEHMRSVIFMGIFLCVFMNLLFFNIGVTLVCGGVTEELSSFYNYETTAKERSTMLKHLMRLPASVSALVFILYMVTGAAWMLYTIDTVGMTPFSSIMFFIMVYYGSYYSAARTFSDTVQSFCNKEAVKIVEKGVVKEEVERIHFYGSNINLLSVLHFFVPILFSGAFLFVLGWCAYTFKLSSEEVFPALVTLMSISALAYFVSSEVLFKRMMKSIIDMRDILGGINKQNLHKVKFASNDLSNEFMYNVYLVNTIIGVLQKILKESLKISMDVIESSNELSVVSNETAVTSLQQNTSIKELLSAMEETDELSKNIAEKIGEVSIVARKTTSNIVDGFEILKQNMQKLDEIKAANDITVEGIKRLTEKISGISEIARIINGIADQTNIIAFNAELEASSAGEVGENFSLVANEIRRLTNSTIQSTNEIRNRITEIQHSSDSLLLSSQSGSKKISDETQIINELNQRFEALKNSSETMDYASEDIKKIIDQQTTSFAQIVITLRQISQATESFSSSIQNISNSAHNLCVISENLKKIQPEDVKEEEKEVK